MKLSDEKLNNIILPLIKEYLSDYGIKTYTVRGEIDASFEEAIYITVNVEKGGDNIYSQKVIDLNWAIREKLAELDDNRFKYLSVNFPRNVNNSMSNPIKRYEKLAEGL